MFVTEKSTMITRYGAYAFATSPRPSPVAAGPPPSPPGAPADPVGPEAPPAPTPTRRSAISASPAPPTDPAAPAVPSAVTSSAGDHTRVSSTTAAAENSDAKI